MTSKRKRDRNEEKDRVNCASDPLMLVIEFVQMSTPLAAGCDRDCPVTNFPASWQVRVSTHRPVEASGIVINAAPFGFDGCLLLLRDPLFFLSPPRLGMSCCVDRYENPCFAHQVKKDKICALAYLEAATSQFVK